MPRVSDLLSALDKALPLRRAATWDKVGLQVGDCAAAVQRVLVVHDVTAATLEEAAGCDAVVTYHPLIFRPLEDLDFKRPVARFAGQLLARGSALISVHTALDHAPPPHALGDALAHTLGLEEVTTLQPEYEALVKVVVFTPPEAIEAVSQAMWNAGAGHVGCYEQCSFRSAGLGTFRPLPGADPYSGEVGRLETAEEFRLETVVPAGCKSAVIAAMTKAHPYEEVAYDCYALDNTPLDYGAGRCGVLPQPRMWTEWAREAAGALQAVAPRMVTAREQIRKIACVPGSGAGFLPAAVAAGCDALVSGDFKHHDALLAGALGINVLDATHSATERTAREMLAHALRAVPDVEVKISTVDTNPFSPLTD